MTESSSSKERAKTYPQLNAQDRRLFEHWQRTFTPRPLYSTEDNPRKGHTLKDIPPPQDIPSPGISGRDRITPIRRSKAELTEEAVRNSTESQRQGCITLVNKLFEHSPIIIFMNSELKKVGCSPPVYCTPCEDKVYGGFHPTMGISICQNNVGSTRRMESTLAHEMVHAFDQCRFKFDYGNLKHVACGEVRAVALSRECRFLDELKYHLTARWHGAEDEFGFNRRMQQCVKRRAVGSVMAHISKPTREEAERVVDQVFPSCFRDTRPFDELY